MDRFGITQFKFNTCKSCLTRYSCVMSEFTKENFARFEAVQGAIGMKPHGFSEYLAAHIRLFKIKLKNGLEPNVALKSASCISVLLNSDGKVDTIEFNIKYQILELFEEGKLWQNS